MDSLVVTSAITFAASLLLTAAVRTAARRWHIVDVPDGHRKLHRRPTPLWGGIAVFGATVAGLLFARWPASGQGREFTDLSNAWILTAGFVCFVGSIDDRFNLPSRAKLVLQILAVLPLMILGFYVDRIVVFGYPIELGWCGVPLTVLWLVGCINALNLIDGMDGLASIVGLSTTAMMGVIAASEGHPHVAAIAIVLTAALAGFLPYNLPPASIFLGDSGSMVIGLSVGVLGIQGALKTSATLAITAPAVAMTLPMFDILAAVVRRRLTGRRFDAPDRLHIHHRLLDRGWTPWQVLCLIGALCLTTGAAATAATIFRRDALAWIAAMTLVVLLIRLQLFGHEEFAMAKEAVVRGVKSVFGTLNKKQRALPQKILLDTTAGTCRNLWPLFLQTMSAKHIHKVELRSYVENCSRRIRWIDPKSPTWPCDRWALSISLPAEDGSVCELVVAGRRPIASPNEQLALTALLKTFGMRFASNPDLFFGPLPKSPTREVYPSPERKAA